jgi:Zn-dependent peptidase ImmA (M78 family)/transcriptional regulator with XRE-family HTH domain
MDEMLEAKITGGVLQWARERRDLTYDEVADGTKIAVGELVAWERGQTFPPFGAAQELAHFLRIPFGFLFLSTHPADTSPIPDFRTVSGHTPAKLSPDLLEVVSEVRLKQDWYREYAEQNLVKPLPFICSVNISTPVDVVSAQISEGLSIDEQVRRECKDWRAYLKRLSDNAQRLGILVMRSGVVGSDSTRPLQVSEFRGFALSDPLAPVIFINSKDAQAAQIFSLVHEVVHLWTGGTGISAADPTVLAPTDVESFCNRIAADVLVPQERFDAEWKSLRDKGLFPDKLSRQFWVSPLVIIRCAFDTRKIGEEEFYRLVRIEKNKPINKKKKSGGDPIRTLLTRNSRRFTNAILSAVSEDRLTYRDGARLLGTSNKFFPDLLGKRFE